MQKTVFAFFISAFSILFAFFILLFYSFSALFAIPIPIFAYKNPAPETSGAGKSPISIASLMHSCQDL